MRQRRRCPHRAAGTAKGAARPRAPAAAAKSAGRPAPPERVRRPGQGGPARAAASPARQTPARAASAAAKSATARRLSAPAPARARPATRRCGRCRSRPPPAWPAAQAATAPAAAPPASWRGQRGGPGQGACAWRRSALGAGPQPFLAEKERAGRWEGAHQRHDSFALVSIAKGPSGDCAKRHFMPLEFAPDFDALQPVFSASGAGR